MIKINLKNKRRNKKGQVRIILELFLFALGIMIALFSFIFINQFSGWISKTAEEDHLKFASSAIACGIVKAHKLNANVTINMDILPSINENSYFIEAFNNQLLLYDLYNYSLRISHGLFYISEDKNINGRAGSSSGKVIIKASGNSIEILR